MIASGAGETVAIGRSHLAHFSAGEECGCGPPGHKPFPKSPTNAVRFLIWGDSEQIITRKKPAAPLHSEPLR
jgi:hypothetical protein